MKATVKIRKNMGKEIKPNAIPIDGLTFNFEKGWTMDEDDPYPSEVAWYPMDDAYPKSAPTWIASGDLVFIHDRIRALAEKRAQDLACFGGE